MIHMCIQHESGQHGFRAIPFLESATLNCSTTRTWDARFPRVFFWNDPGVMLVVLGLWLQGIWLQHVAEGVPEHVERTCFGKVFVSRSGNHLHFGRSWMALQPQLFQHGILCSIFGAQSQRPS